jgi:hypothetical protein
MATSTTSCEAIWLHKLLARLFDQGLDPMVIYYDYQSCIKLPKNPVFHDSSKNIKIKYHFIQDMIQKRAMKLQHIATREQEANFVVLISTRAKYMAASSASCETIWLCKLLARLFDQELDPTVIYYDYQSCIKLSKNPLFHDSSKNIEIRYHLIQDMIQKGVMKLQYIPTNQ